MASLEDQARQGLSNWAAKWIFRGLIFIFMLSLAMNVFMGWMLSVKRTEGAAAAKKSEELAAKIKNLEASNEILARAKSLVAIQFQKEIVVLAASTNDLVRGEAFYSDPLLSWRVKADAYIRGSDTNSGALK